MMKSRHDRQSITLTIKNRGLNMARLHTLCKPLELIERRMLRVRNQHDRAAALPRDTVLAIPFARPRPARRNDAHHALELRILRSHGIHTVQVLLHWDKVRTKERPHFTTKGHAADVHVGLGLVYCEQRLSLLLVREHTRDLAGHLLRVDCDLRPAERLAQGQQESLFADIVGPD